MSHIVCNSNLKHKWSIMLGNSYTNTLDAVSESLLQLKKEWLYLVLIQAMHLQKPLYQKPLYINNSYCEYWTNHLGLDPIPNDGTFVQVRYAMQGHTEASRLWEKLIDGLLCNYSYNMTSTSIAFPSYIKWMTLHLPVSPENLLRC